MLFVVISIAMAQALEVLDPSDESNYNKKMQSKRMELDHYRQRFPFAEQLTKVGVKCLWHLALEIVKSIEKEHYRQDGFLDKFVGEVNKKVGEVNNGLHKAVGELTKGAEKLLGDAVKFFNGLKNSITKGFEDFKANLGANVDNIIAIYKKKGKPMLKKFWAKAWPVLKKAGLKCLDAFKDEAKKFIPLKRQTE